MSNCHYNCRWWLWTTNAHMKQFFTTFHAKYMEKWVVDYCVNYVIFSYLLFMIITLRNSCLSIVLVIYSSIKLINKDKYPSLYWFGIFITKLIPFYESTMKMAKLSSSVIKISHHADASCKPSQLKDCAERLFSWLPLLVWNILLPCLLCSCNKYSRHQTCHKHSFAISVLLGLPQPLSLSLSLFA